MFNPNAIGVGAHADGVAVKHLTLGRAKYSFDVATVDSPAQIEVGNFSDADENFADENCDDCLAARSGRDLLIGDGGADTLLGGAGDDILIGGTGSLSNDTAALNAIMAEWTSLTNYAQRVANLLNGGGANGTTKLNSTAIQNDSAADRLTGSGNVDWFFQSNADILLDFNAASGELKTLV